MEINALLALSSICLQAWSFPLPQLTLVHVAKLTNVFSFSLFALFSCSLLILR